MQHVLLITTADDLAADLLVLAANRRAISLIRFNQEDFPSRNCIRWDQQCRIEFFVDGHILRGDEISGAWYRRSASPRMVEHTPPHVAKYTSSESSGFLQGVWDTAPWVWMNRPSSVSRAENKLLQLFQAQRVGLLVPDTVATNEPGSVRRFAACTPSIVAKTIVGGRLEFADKHHFIFTTEIDEEDLASDYSLQSAPVIYQERLPNQFDVRVTVVRDQVFAAKILVDQRTHKEVDWRTVERSRLRYDEYSLPSDVANRCVRLVRDFDLSFSALDFLVTPAGQHVFLELNPSGQWGWIERTIGQPITQSILDCLIGDR